MMLYYRFLHPMGPLNPFQEKKIDDIENTAAANTHEIVSSSSSTSPDFTRRKRPVMYKVSIRRTFKSLYPVDIDNNVSIR